ncbi:MAG: hypothetical protein AAB592_02465 [Patescibacteria group bacterium]
MSRYSYLIKFRTEEGEPIQGKVIFRSEEYSFDFEPRASGGGQSIAINDLQLEFDLETFQILYIYGLCTYCLYWKQSILYPPPASHGKFFAEFMTNKEILPGMSYGYTEPAEWPVYVDFDSGWVCIGQPEVAQKIQAVEFATNSIAVLDNGKLIAIWLRPEDLLGALKHRKPLPSEA